MEQGLFQALKFTTVFTYRIELYGYCLFWSVILIVTLLASGHHGGPGKAMKAM